MIGQVKGVTFRARIRSYEKCNCSIVWNCIGGRENDSITSQNIIQYVPKETKCDSSSYNRILTHLMQLRSFRIAVHLLMWRCRKWIIKSRIHKHTHKYIFHLKRQCLTTISHMNRHKRAIPPNQHVFQSLRIIIYMVWTIHSDIQFYIHSKQSPQIVRARSHTKTSQWMAQRLPRKSENKRKDEQIRAMVIWSVWISHSERDSRTAMHGAYDFMTKIQGKWISRWHSPCVSGDGSLRMSPQPAKICAIRTYVSIGGGDDINLRSAWQEAQHASPAGTSAIKKNTCTHRQFRVELNERCADWFVAQQTFQAINANERKQPQNWRVKSIKIGHCWRC